MQRCTESSRTDRYEIDDLGEKEGTQLFGGMTALPKLDGGMVGNFVADKCVEAFGSESSSYHIIA